MDNPALNDTEAEGALRQLAAAADRGPSVDGNGGQQPPTISTNNPTDSPNPPPHQPPRDGERARKDAERRDRSWKALDEEKTRHRQERETFERERRAFLQAREAAGGSDNDAPADDAAPAPGEQPPAGAGPGLGRETAPDPQMEKLREDVARQKAEIARLTQLTSLYNGSGSGSPPAPPKRFEELSDREMETELRRMARGLDGF